MDERSFVAAQDFLLATKQYWTTTLYRALRDEYENRATSAGAPSDSSASERLATEANDVGDTGWRDVDSALADSLGYQTYSWLERHLQRFKYAGHYGLVPWHETQRSSLELSLDDPRAESFVTLNSDLPLPHYYTAVDVHQHPGGIWGDSLAGWVYERGARTTTLMLGDSHRDLHQRFTDEVAAVTKPQRIADLGCGFGKSTRPFYESFPEAEVVGVDFSAPCLRLAALDAADSGRNNVHFYQGDACDTGLEAASFDVVTSTMLLHELPPNQIRALMREAARLLKPGGRLVQLDFYRLCTPFERFIHYGHARRNNEPFMQSWAEMDAAAEMQAAGFGAVEVAPFRESANACVDDSPSWRFPWTTVSGVRA